jgi:hypothetical protein
VPIFARRRRTPVRSGGARQRRRVELARSSFNASGLAAGNAQIREVLAPWNTDLGLVGNLPGMTVMGIRYRFSVSYSAAQAAPGAIVTWGFQVTDQSVDNVDIDPSIFLHQDWMEWGNDAGLIVPAGARTVLLGNGDDGFRTVRSRRKLGQIQETLFFAVNSTVPSGGTWGFAMTSSVALALP